MNTSVLRALGAFAMVLVLASTAQAQWLFVNDNDNITYNTDSILNDLTGAGVVYDTYDIGVEGVPPNLGFMSGYSGVIWYCSGDGAGLGLWDATDDLHNLALQGVPIWFIGTDMLYAGYGVTPYEFDITDLPLSTMGISSYDVQSYGDDGNVGCPEMDADAGVGSSFSPAIVWVFATLWWADGCTPSSGTDVIYAMGPSSYVLAGDASMVHKHTDGMNVMSTFFDPVLIDTYENRVLFIQQTVAYMASGTGVAEVRPAKAVSVVPNGVGGAVVSCKEPMRSLEVRSMSGQLLERVAVGDRTRANIDMQGFAEGVLVIIATTAKGERMSAKWVVQH